MTIDFSSSSERGRVYVRKYFNPPSASGLSVLPHYWELSGMTGINFEYDLIVAYNHDEIADANLLEDYLTILHSIDGGVTWKSLATVRDPIGNTLQAQGMGVIGMFAIGDLVVPGDFDGDYDVDQEDFGCFQACLNVSNNPACQKAYMDGDNDIDESDAAKFIGCMTGPNVIGDPSCAD